MRRELALNPLDGPSDTDNRSGRFPTLIDRASRAVMRDGVEIGMVILRPDAPGRFPAIISYGPYRTLTAIKAGYSDDGYNHRWDGPSWFAERGYAVITFDVRGTGNSGGWTTDIYSIDEQVDACEMVEWAAEQPWCDGNVGMWGMSYGGVVQWQVGIRNPPHLKTLVVGSSNDTVYGDWTYPGGSLRPYMFDTFSPLMTANNLAPPDPEFVGDRWLEMWQERLERNAPWGIGFLEHPLDDAYWTERSLQPDCSRIRVPVLLWSGWADCYPTPTLRAFSRLQVPKKVIVGPWGHDWPEGAVPGPRIEFRAVLLRWFDHWLKDRDTGVMDEPPVTLWVRRYSEPQALAPIDEPGYWRAESEWPPPASHLTPMYLCNGGRLGDAPEDGPGADSYDYDPTVGETSGIDWGGGVMPWAQPLDQRADEARSLVFTSEPLGTAMEVIGAPVARLFVSSTAQHGSCHVKVSDVTPEGTSKLIAAGGLLSSHRHSDTAPEPWTPGTVEELTIDLRYVSYVFERGHRIRLSIASADLQNAWPASGSARHTVHRGAGQASYLALPIAGAQEPVVMSPELPRSPRRAPAPADFTGCRHLISRDVLGGDVTVELGRESGLLPISGSSSSVFGDSESRRIARSRFKVSKSNPGKARLEASHAYTIDRPERRIEIEAVEVLESDHTSFSFRSQVSIQVDGHPYWAKTWTASRPRRLD